MRLKCGTIIGFQLTHSRGVRLSVLTSIAGLPDFNSRTHVECDGVIFFTVIFPQDFNSRTHVECDISSAGFRAERMDFNSRTHVECDSLLLPQEQRYFAISTHALTWSATRIRG